jgi:type IV secretory pathway VirJ component
LHRGRVTLRRAGAGTRCCDDHPDEVRKGEVGGMGRSRGTCALILGLTVLSSVLVPLAARADVPVDSTRNRGAGLDGLPLVVVPATTPGSTLAVVISGDGGWAHLEREVAATLAQNGVTVVGLNSLKYFWSRRTPEGAAADLARVLRFYLDSARLDDVLLVGYSRGADVLPFMASRLPPDLLRRVRVVALLGPSRSVDFKFHVMDWLKDAQHRSDLPVLPEAEKLVGQAHVLCVYGREEKDTICPALSGSAASVVPLVGAHHFDGDYPELGRLVLQAASDRSGDPVGPTAHR